MHKRGSNLCGVFCVLCLLFSSFPAMGLDIEKPLVKVGVIGASCLLLSIPAMTFDIRKPSSRDFVFGYGYGGRLKNKEDYVHNTLALDFSYHYNEKSFWRYFQFQLEPFVSFVSSPETNGEAGCLFFIKYQVPWEFPLKPYIRGGSGVILISQESEQQTTGLNFASQVGYGISYAFPNSSLFLEYRTRHISNWFMGSPNAGIDTSIWLLGIGGHL